MDEYIYYCEASDEINTNGEKYTKDIIYPDVWVDLVTIQTEYYMILDELLEEYIFKGNNEILEKFAESCVSYDY